MEETNNKQLIDIKVNKNRVDSFIIDYGPILVLVQSIITGIALILNGLYVVFSENPKLITWAVFSPVYGGVLLILLAESIAVRNFFLKIPKTFSQIWVDGLIEKTPSDGDVIEKFNIFLENLNKKLNSKKHFFISLPLAFLGLVFLWNTKHFPYVIGIWLNELDLVTKIVVTIVNILALFFPAVAVGYAMGISSWKSLVTAIYVHRFCTLVSAK